MAVAATPYYALPTALVTETDPLSFSYRGKGYGYDAGLGWFGLESNLSAPRLDGTNLYVGGDVLTALGVTPPRLAGVRSSGGGTVRVVFDFDNLDAASLAGLTGSGVASLETPLTLRLPLLMLPQDLPGRLGGLNLSAAPGGDATVLRLSGPAARYDVFALSDPTRLVVDLRANPVSTPPTQLPTVQITPQEVPETTPDADADLRLDLREALLGRLVPRAGERDLGGGATLRSFTAPTLAGESQVDLIEILPNRGDFAVVGGSYGLKTPSELTGGALVGLNASYFDPASGRSIGFLKAGGRLESLPSRNRAAVGFGFGAPVVGRPAGSLRVTVDGFTQIRLALAEEQVTLHTDAGAWVSSPRQGAVVVSAAGRVLENKVGPCRVPAGGFVLSYLPEVRPLALVNAGQQLTVDLEVDPGVWRFVPEAVEAGPLLVAGGRSAYRPGLEAFDVEDLESNVNRRTTRAALGVRTDGTVLLLVATNMTAGELVPLLIDLRAENALQLDSGGSSTLIAGGEVVNRPAALQRKVATVITYTPH